MKPDPIPGCPGRRAFCCLACAALAAAVAPAALLAGTQPAPEDADPRRVTSATRAALPAGTVLDFRRQGRFYLVADAGGIYAVTAVCTHRGCTVLHEDPQVFDCPCHDSQYDLTGAVLRGPAKEPLAHFQVSEREPGGPLVVDLGRPVAADVRL